MLIGQLLNFAPWQGKNADREKKIKEEEKSLIKTLSRGNVSLRTGYYVTKSDKQARLKSLVEDAKKS